MNGNQCQQKIQKSFLTVSVIISFHARCRWGACSLAVGRRSRAELKDLLPSGWAAGLGGDGARTTSRLRTHLTENPLTTYIQGGGGTSCTPTIQWLRRLWRCSPSLCLLHLPMKSGTVVPLWCHKGGISSHIFPPNPSLPASCIYTKLLIGHQHRRRLLSLAWFLPL